MKEVYDTEAYTLQSGDNAPCGPLDSPPLSDQDRHVVTTNLMKSLFLKLDLSGESGTLAFHSRAF